MVAPLVAASMISAGSSLLGGLFGSNQAKRQEELQKEFAQNAIQWKVKDAAKAGVHPLYALGANTVSYSPSVGSTDLGAGIANAGQDIGRAIGAAHTPEAKASTAMTALSLERGQLENDLLRSQIRAMNAPGSPPGVPSAVGDNADPLKMAGVSYSASPHFSDAQRFEDRYGDAISSAMGVPIAFSDAFHNLDTRPSAAEGHRPTFNQVMSAVSRLFGGK